jgi:ubiquinone biosynthesis protein
MLKTSHVGRYTELALLISRYGIKDFQLQISPEDVFEDAAVDRPMEPECQERARAFAKALESMGPTFVKFGQILSTRPDVVPPEYIAELEALQDSVEPFPYSEVEAIVESELKVRVSKLFEVFEPVPLAAASLGQVHRATLRDGREVVVKVQRPGVQDVVKEDLQVFTEIAQTLEKHSSVARKMNLAGTVEQARRTLSRELNYLQEARNAEILRHNLAEFPQIYIPVVVADLCTEKVLTTELVRGKKISKLTALAIVDNDYAALATVFTRAYLKQICVDGFWHSDPHPGNVFLREGQLVLLDFGMVSRISSDFQDQMIKLLLGVSTNKAQLVADACIKMGSIQEGFQPDKFLRDISDVITHYYDVDLARANVGQMIFKVIAVASANEIQVPSELALLAKTLLHLDVITRKLDPDFDPQGTIREYAEEIVIKKVRQKFAPHNFYSSLLDVNQIMVEGPGAVREIMDMTRRGRLSFQIQFGQLDHLLKGIYKIANRITVGLIVAALLVASSLMMGVQTRFHLFGYPAIAVVGYLAAASIALYLAISIILSDRHDQQKVKESKKA